MRTNLGETRSLHYMDKAAAIRSDNDLDALEAFGGLLTALSLRTNVEMLENEEMDKNPRINLAESVLEEPSVESSRIETSRVSIGYEQNAVQRVRRILESLVPVFERGTDDPLTEIENALQGVRVPPPKQSDDGRVRVVGLQDTPMAEFSQLYVLGATRENLPSGPDRPQYFQQIGDALDLFPSDHHRKIERYRFGLLLANAESVHITTPAETMDGNDVLPSPMLEELERVADISRSNGVADESRCSREDVQRSLSGVAPDSLTDLLTRANEDGVFSIAQVAAISNGTKTSANRVTPEPTPHDGQVSLATLERVGADLTKAPYSPSRLNNYAKCGFKYYLKNGLELSEPDDYSPDVGRFAVGDIIHGTLEHFYQGLLYNSDGPVDLDQYNRLYLERRLLAAGEQAVGDMDERFESSFDRHQLRTIFAGLATPAENDRYAVRDESENQSRDHNNGNGLLVRVLDRELSSDGSPRFLETDFGDTFSVTLDDETIFPIHGRIDRIDLEATNDGELAASVIDYKTFSTDATDAIKGLDFQIPSYLIGARSLVENELNVDPVRVDGEYRVIKPPTTVRYPASLGQRVDWDLDLDIDSFLLDIVSDRVERAVSGIESGAFHPAVIGEDAAHCHYCEFADTCDVRHHRRFETIEAIDREDHPTYVPAGARHGKLTEQIAVDYTGGEN